MTTKSVDLPHLRSVVLAGHAGSGKTTLAEQLLFEPARSRVSAGSTTARRSLDFEPEEQKRQRVAEPRGRGARERRHRITLIDTPGYPDFVGRGHPGLRRRRRRAVRHGRLGRRRGRAREGRRASAGQTGRAACFVINKCDRENADPIGALDALRARSATRSRRSSSRSARPRRSRATSTSSTARRTAGTAARRSRSRSRPSSKARSPRRRDQLLEAAAEADDDVLTKYLEGEEISDAELDACLHKGVRESVLAPVLVAQRDQGHRHRGPARRVRPLPALAGGGGSGRRRTTPRRATTVEVPPDPAGPLLVRVFKTTADPFVGRLTYLRVLSGTLQSQGHVWNVDARRGRADRPAAPAPRQGAGADRRAQGRRDRRGREARPSPRPATRSPRRRSRYVLPPLDVPGRRRSCSRSSPQSKGDLDKMGPALQRMLEEEPTARVERTDDRRAGPARDGRGAHRGHHRAPQAQVRGGDRDHDAEGAVQGDDPRQDQGPRPVQEADRRPRDVRRRLDRARAEPRRRRRVRREGRRRLGARSSSSRASRRASARRPPRASSPATR